MNSIVSFSSFKWNACLRFHDWCRLLTQKYGILQLHIIGRPKWADIDSNEWMNEIKWVSRIQTSNSSSKISSFKWQTEQIWMITCPSLHSHQFWLIGKQTKQFIESASTKHTFNQSVAITINNVLFAFFIVRIPICFFLMFARLIVRTSLKWWHTIFTDALCTIKICCAVYLRTIRVQTNTKTNEFNFFFDRICCFQNIKIDWKSKCK